MASLRRALNIARRIPYSFATTSRTSASVSVVPSYFPCGSQFGRLSHFSSSNYSVGTQSISIDLSTEESKRRLLNRLLYRSRQRGFLELDLVLGKWVEEHIYSMGENEIKALVDVLGLENPDLWKWLTNQEEPPAAVSMNPVFCAVRDKVMNNLNSHAAPETRAIPGQAWVRGWDDIKRSRDGPVAGNQ